MCLYPRLIQNPKYKKNKKNGGVIPPCPDERCKMVPIGCQNCMECRKQKARNWQVRLSEDIKANRNGKFITLTFSNEAYSRLYKEMDETLEGYEKDNAIATKAIRLFLERWRKKYKKSLRHWLITELGHNGTENIHIHGIIWTNESYATIREKWGYGYIYPREYEEKQNYVNEATVNYIIKYVTKTDEKHKTYKPIILTSPGIGNNYKKNRDRMANKYQGTATNETYRLGKGNKIALPIYYRNIMYSEKEREQLWINKLNKHERWVLGVRIDIKHSDKRYWAALKEAQAKNKRLGYGKPDTLQWGKIKYEKERRQLMQLARLE